MTYRKFKADYLFMGEGLTGEDMVLVTAADGTVEGVFPAADAGEGVEYYPGLLSPGFVNCHCHLELSHMKGVVPERTGLVDFLTAVIRQRAGAQAGSAREAAAEAGAAGVDGAQSGGVMGAAVVGAQTAGSAAAGNAESNLEHMVRAEQEMLDNGIVAVGDICNTADTLSLKTEGRLYYHNFIETMGFIEQGARDRFTHSLGVFQTFAEAYSLPIEANSIVPHAPYSVSSTLFRLVAGFPGNHVLTIHNQEAEAENEFYLSGKGDFLRLYQQMGLDVSFFKGTGKRSLASYLPYFYRNQSLILVHNVATDEEDLRALASEGGAGGATLYFCLCPNANRYISDRLPDVGMLVRNDCTIVLGTDSLASNHQLSILEEIKTLEAAFPQLDLASLLRWATYNGARALQLDGMVGSFAPGKQPGVVLIGNMEGRRLGAGATVRRLV
ncbi:MAG TPA: amidohydrolase family protein [Puia sp.]|nr:amidohydrolase family protein [Puia sp.]